MDSDFLYDWNDSKVVIQSDRFSLMIEICLPTPTQQHINTSTHQRTGLSAPLPPPPPNLGGWGWGGRAFRPPPARQCWGQEIPPKRQILTYCWGGRISKILKILKILPILKEICSKIHSLSSNFQIFRSLRSRTAILERIITCNLPFYDFIKRFALARKKNLVRFFGWGVLGEADSSKMKNQ